MKYVNTDGSPVTRDIDLGHSSHRGDDGRHRKTIRRSPQGKGEDVGYVVIGGSVVLTAPREGQTGILVPILTNTGYHRHCSGSSSLICGSAEAIASGSWREGAAGRLGGGIDSLWHISGPAIIWIQYSGSRGPGQHFYLVADGCGVICHKKKDNLIGEIVLDNDPRLRDAMQSLRGKEGFPSWLEGALSTVENIEDEVGTVSEVAHVGDLESLALFDLQVTDPTRGVGSLQGNVFEPGTRQLAVVRVGPGGGKRYHYDIEEQFGLEVISEYRPHRSASVVMVAYVLGSGWRVRWTEYKDGEPTGSFVSSSEGIRREVR